MPEVSGCDASPAGKGDTGDLCVLISDRAAGGSTPRRKVSGNLGRGLIERSDPADEIVLKQRSKSVFQIAPTAALIQ